MIPLRVTHRRVGDAQKCTEKGGDKVLAHNDEDGTLTNRLKGVEGLIRGEGNYVFTPTTVTRVSIPFH